MTRKLFKVGAAVEFIFSRTPATAEGKSLFAQRARNTEEARHLTAKRAAYKGEWVNEWVRGTVEDLTCGSYKIDGYWIPNEEVRIA